MVRRRSAQSLHRAVVLRSAQRAQLERERYEDQQEEDEVEASVSPERDLGPLEFDNNEGEHEDEDEDEGHDLPDVSSVSSLFPENFPAYGLLFSISP